jgi:hypothetical protein
MPLRVYVPSLALPLPSALHIAVSSDAVEVRLGITNYPKRI